MNIIAKNATTFALRDENSMNTLKAAGIDTSKIKIVDDIVLSNKVLQEISFRKNSEKIKLGFVYIYAIQNITSLYTIIQKK